MWWTRAERRRGVEAVVVLAAEIMAPMTRTESTGPFLMVSGSSSAPTGPQPRGRPRPAHRHRLHRHRLRAAWAMRACRRPDPRDRGVDVAPAGRGEDVEGAVAVEPDLSQLRLPAPGEQRASRQQNRRGGALARTCRWPAQVASRLGGRGVYGVGQARERTSRARGLVRVRVQHAHRPRARSGRADRSCAACVAAGRAGGHTCGWWVGIPGL